MAGMACAAGFGFIFCSMGATLLRTIENRDDPPGPATARLPGEIRRLLSSALTDFHLRRDAAPKDAAPAQFGVNAGLGGAFVLGP
ncbi:MAG: hypothetical protein AAB268_09280 [Elusimicrobiota bacterium]